MKYRIAARSLRDALIVIACVLFLVRAANGQSSSLFHGATRSGSSARPESSAESGVGRPQERASANPVLDRTSLIAVELADPKQFRIHDIVTIVVQENKKFESEGENIARRRFELSSELNEWFRFSEGKLVAETFPNGMPNIDYKLDSRTQNRGENEREDRLVARIAAEVIDVKPNGNLVIEARRRIWHDEEEIIVSLTGVCRSTDITPDNTILSSKVADFDFVAKHTGAVRDQSRRGWATRLFDFLRPI